MVIWDHVPDLVYSFHKTMASETDALIKDEHKKLNNCKYCIHKKTDEKLPQIEERKKKIKQTKTTEKLFSK